jgi:predicted TIM-barrel fold metal-dependent hydrolase
VGDLSRRLKRSYGKTPQLYKRDPLDTFHDHVWVAPFYEDDIDLLAEVLGDDRLLFGSDFPHAEGLAVPTRFVHDIAGFSPEAVRRVMRDNAREFLALGGA